MTNTLHYGDNLHVLREHVKDESVDLVYLDPPFNSNANYNILFKSPQGHDSDAQIEAFEDTWHWNEAAEDAYGQVLKSGNTDAADLLRAMRGFLGDNDMMSYLAMMAIRLIELHRVLKPTGSLYLHCDPTASHYLKLLLDAVLGAKNYRSEVIWQRTSAHNSAKRWGPIHDVVFFYSKSSDYVWNRTFTAYDESYIKRYYRNFDENNRRYRMSDLTASGTRNGESGKPWNGFNPTAHGRHWAIPKLAKEQFTDAPKLKTLGWLALLKENGMVEMTGNSPGWPHFRRFLDQMEGQSPQDIIDDIPPLGKRHAERLGYPTQKPLALLERIIAASSNPGDVVLDPFCGCGTAVHAAQKLDRQWIGIDITHLAVSLIEKRMQEAFPELDFAVKGRPQLLDAARDLAARDKNEFEKWAVTAIGGTPYRTGKGADGGVDGLIYFNGFDMEQQKVLEEKAIISIKGGNNKGVGMVAELVETIGRQNAAVGILLMAAMPTRQMEARAAAAGTYDLGEHGRYPRIQIITLAEFWQKGTLPRLPNVDRTGLKRAKAEAKEQGKLL